MRQRTAGRRTGTWVALGLTAAVLTGCGSTVQYSETGVGSSAAGGADGLGSVQGGSGDGSLGGSGSTGSGGFSGGTSGVGGVGTTTGSATSGGAGATGSGSGGSTGSGAGTGATGGTGGTGTAGGRPGGTGTGTGGTGALPTFANAESGRGFTKTTVRIGVATSSSFDAVAGTFGISGVGYKGDLDRTYAAIASSLNAKGGLAGRKIEIVPHDFDALQVLNNPAAAYQAACATWTQDKPVFAVVLIGTSAEDTLLNCLQRAQTPLVGVAAGLDYPLHYAQTYAKYPLFFNVDQMEGGLFDQISIARLTARGFFGPWNTATGQPGRAGTPTKVGIIGFDDADGELQTASRLRQLAANKIPVGNVLKCPRALSAKISCTQGAVLKFSGTGVTHVLGADTIFMSNATNQNYFPRHFIAQQAAIFAANVNPKQLGGAMGQGYIPRLDVPASQFPGDPTPATAACTAIMRGAGQGTSDPSSLWTQGSICDGFTFLGQAVSAVKALSAPALKAGLESLGARPRSAITWGTFFGPDDHASVSTLRDIVFRPEIKNFSYASTTDHGAR